MESLTTQDLERGESPLSVWNTTTAIGEQYSCDFTFAALTVDTSSPLLLIASVTVILGFLTRAPDVLGYVSTLARDDPYFGKPVASHLDGMETTRSLRNVRVIIGDVHKKDDVGHVAFASTDIGPERVHKRRLCD